jgi:CheY-like chemotaxis protein
MKTILLIEDDYVDVESVKRALKKIDASHVLHVAHNGADALEMLTQNNGSANKISPDVILLDINMPKMNGLEFLRIIRNYYSLKNIKIFVITTSEEEFDKMAADGLGVDGYIIKPLDFKNKKHEATVNLQSFLLNE